MVIGAALLALLLANTKAKTGYFKLNEKLLTLPVANISLSVEEWVSSGLLTIFFFTVGMELNYELFIKNKGQWNLIVVPSIGAVCGVLGPALIYWLINSVHSEGETRGWPIPTATDIAFAVAILTMIAPRIPNNLKTFLLTLAVVDDLLAILIIAFKYTDQVRFTYLLVAIGLFFVFWLLLKNWITNWYILIPLALLAWIFFQKSAVHPTIAGVILGFCIPVSAASETIRSFQRKLDYVFNTLSCYLVVPVFAFFAAGIYLGGFTDFTAALTTPIALGVGLGLLLGKPLGITVGVFISKLIFRKKLFPEANLFEYLTVVFLGGVGFTVSLLMSNLAFPGQEILIEQAKIGVVVGSLLAILGGIFFSRLNRKTLIPK